MVGRTTHLLLFSVEPQADGLRNVEAIHQVLSQQSPLSKAMREAAEEAPQLLAARHWKSPSFRGVLEAFSMGFHGFWVGFSIRLASKKASKSRLSSRRCSERVKA